MTSRANFRLTGRSKDSYLECVLDFPLASIKSDKHLAKDQQVIDRLLSRGRLNQGEETYFEALSDLVGAHEDEHHALPPVSDADLLIEPRHGAAEVHYFRSARRKETLQSEDDPYAGGILSRGCAGGEFLSVAGPVPSTAGRVFQELDRVTEPGD